MRFSNKFIILIEILTNYAEFVLPYLFSRNKFVHFIIEVKKTGGPGILAPPPLMTPMGVLCILKLG